MTVQIRTERGSVRVIAPECARRSCLHVHWSRHAHETTVAPPTGKHKGAKIAVFPLVCVRNEEHGCPHPLPDPEPR